MNQSFVDVVSLYLRMVLQENVVFTSAVFQIYVTLSLSFFLTSCWFCRRKIERKNRIIVMKLINVLTAALIVPSQIATITIATNTEGGGVSLSHNGKDSGGLGEGKVSRLLLLCNSSLLTASCIVALSRTLLYIFSISPTKTHFHSPIFK